MLRKLFLVLGLGLFVFLPLCLADEFADLKKKCAELPPAEALAICRQCLALRPDDAQVNWLLGRAHAERAEHETALQHYEKAVELAPDSLVALFTLAFCYENNSSDPTRAHAVYERILSLGPDPLDPREKSILRMAYQGLGNSYLYDRKAFDQAIVHYKKAYDLEPNDFICEKIASAYKELGDYAGELPWRNEAIALNGADGVHYSLRGSTYLNLGEKEMAIADYNKAIQLDPTQPHPYNNIAMIYAERKETIPDAIRYYELAHERYRDETDRIRTRNMIAKLEERLAAPPGPEETAAALGLPADRGGFQKLLEEHRYRIDGARSDFVADEEEKANETLNAIRETHLKLEKLHAACEQDGIGSGTDFEDYLRQVSSQIGDLVAWYDKVRDDHAAQKEEERRRRESAPREIAQRYQDVEKPEGYTFIKKTLEDFEEWRVVADYRESFDSPYVRLGRPTDTVVFYDLPLDAASFRRQPLIIQARIDRRMDDRFVISNAFGKEALAAIPENEVSKSTVRYGAYYHMVCRLTDIATVATTGGLTKPVAILKVDGLIEDDAYRQFARYVAGHPQEFPPADYLLIENIVP